MPHSPTELVQTSAGHEHINREQAIVFRDDDERVPRPDEAGGGQGYRLGDGKGLHGPSEVT